MFAYCIIVWEKCHVQSLNRDVDVIAVPLSEEREKNITIGAAVTVLALFSSS